MIVEISPHKFELRSRHTGRVLGTHPSRAKALRQEAAIKASQARAGQQARAARRNPDPRAREPGETATQQAIRNYTLPVIIGVGILGVLWLVNRPAAQSAYVLQTRPIPANPTDAQRTTTIEIAQSQLKSLGYPVTKVDGISGPETQAAMTSFINANQAAVARAGIAYGQDQRAALIALDDAYRAHFGIAAA